jgi:hypothetical protein
VTLVRSGLLMCGMRPCARTFFECDASHGQVYSTVSTTGPDDRRRRLMRNEQLLEEPHRLIQLRAIPELQEFVPGRVNEAG